MKAMTVYVRTYAHRTITLHNMIMVSDVKRAIYRAIGVGPERQKLFYRGRVLQHDYPLQEEGVCHGDVITSLTRLRTYGITCSSTPRVDGQSEQSTQTTRSAWAPARTASPSGLTAGSAWSS